MRFSLRVRGTLEPQQLAGVMSGELDAGHVQVTSCELQQEGEPSNHWYEVVTRGATGKELRMLIERQGAVASRILRTRLGTLELDRHLKRGQARPLTAQELADLLGAIDAPPATPDS